MLIDRFEPPEAIYRVRVGGTLVEEGPLKVSEVAEEGATVTFKLVSKEFAVEQTELVEAEVVFVNGPTVVARAVNL